MHMSKNCVLLGSYSEQTNELLIEKHKKQWFLFGKSSHIIRRSVPNIHKYN